MEGLVCKGLEESLLSTIINNNDVFYEAELKEEMFTSIRIDIFLAIKELIQKGEHADVVSIYERLGGKVKASDISFISDSPILTTETTHTAEKLSQYEFKRTIARSCENALKKLSEYSDPREVALGLKSLEFADTNEQAESVRDIALTRFQEIEKQIKEGIKPGLMTGHRTIDSRVGGFLRGEWVVIAARPGMGKTSLAMNWARNWGHMSYTGLVFSLEMSKSQLIDRMACDVGDVDNSYIFQNKFHESDLKGPIWKNYKSAMRTIRQMQMFIDDSAKIDVGKMLVRAKSIKARFGLDFVIIDYLQLVDGWNKEGQGPKSEITSAMKRMARELDVPVITLSQMNREIERRSSKGPKNSDLRDAGSIEQDADHIIFPLLPSKFDDCGEEDKHSAFLYLTKCRRGETGKLNEMRWDGEYFRFTDKEKRNS